jgi:hypothetical protein
VCYRLVTDDDLNQAGRIPQIDEGHPAVVAPTCDPAGKRDG